MRPETKAKYIESPNFSHNGSANSGTVDTYPFTLSGAARSYVSAQFSGGGKLRLVVTPADSTVAATFAGYTFGSTSSRPSVTFAASPVPEPATAALSLVGLSILGAASAPAQLIRAALARCN